MTIGDPPGSDPAQLSDWLVAVDVARRRLRFYPEDHPTVAPAIEELAAMSARLPRRVWLLQVSPEGFSTRDGDLGAAGTRTRQLAHQLFQLGVIGFGVRPPIERGSLERFVRLASGLRDRPEEEDRERVLAEAERIEGIELVPLDPAWFVLSDGIAAGAVRGGGLWNRLVEVMTGGALVDGEGGGGLSAGEIAELVDGAGDPFGFMKLLVEHVVSMLDEAEHGGGLLDGMALLAGVDEIVRLVKPENQRELARLMVQSADSPGALQSRLPEILSAGLFLDGVEALLEIGEPLPAGVARLLARLADPAQEGSGLRRGMVDASEAERVRAAELAQRAGVPVGATRTPASLAYVDQPSMRRFLAEMQPHSDPVPEFDETVVRSRLDEVLRAAYKLWPRAFLGGALGERLVSSYFVHVELGEIDEAGVVARDLLAGEDQRLLRRLTGREGVASLLDALSVWGKERRHDVARIVTLFGPRLVPALIDGIRDEESLSRRRRLLEMVVAVGEPAVPMIEKLLSDRRWFVVRNAILLLRRLGGATVADIVAPLTVHDDPRVVAEVVRTLTAARDGRALEGMRRLISTDDDRAWREVLALAPRLRHPEVGRMLAARLAEVRGGDLRDSRTLELIGLVGGFDLPEVVEQLARLAGLAQWRHTFRLTPVWEATAEAAAQIGTPSAVEVLRTLARLRDPAAELATRLLEGRSV